MSDTALSLIRCTEAQRRALRHRLCADAAFQPADELREWAAHALERCAELTRHILALQRTLAEHEPLAALARDPEFPWSEYARLRRVYVARALRA